MNDEGRIRTLQRRLQQEGLGAIVVTSWENLWYLTGIEHQARRGLRPDQMVLVVPAEGEVTAIPTQIFSKSLPTEYPNIKLVLPYAEDSEINPFKSKGERVAEAVGRYGLSGQRIGVEMGTLTVPNYLELGAKLNENTLVRADRILQKMRAIKNPDELDRVRRACRLTMIITEEVVRNYLVPGITERELAAIIRRKDLEYDAVEPGFIHTQVFSGPRSYFGGIDSSRRRIQEHDIVLLDWGVNFGGYYCDITAAYCLGKPTPKQEDTAKFVGEALTMAIDMIKPGVITGDVDEYVRKYFEKHGLADSFHHRLGHGMGISVNEWPPLATPDRTVIEPGMVFAVEPGIYYPESGIRLEDNVIVGKDGCENLTEVAKGIVVI